ncbi:four helix bundle protein [Candidatus Collierbacteria bacterium]|nr:four helix bundle protein [Candidatus Collierbacteria bacterium]
MLEGKKTFFSIEDTGAHKLAHKAGEIVWSEVQKWPWLAKRTLGSQWIDATDSVSANLVEGFGRFHKKDRVKFYYNAKGSALESLEWARKAIERKLIDESKAKEIIAILEQLPREINFQIKYSMEKLKS